MLLYIYKIIYVTAQSETWLIVVSQYATVAKALDLH